MDGTYKTRSRSRVDLQNTSEPEVKRVHVDVGVTSGVTCEPHGQPFLEYTLPSTSTMQQVLLLDSSDDDGNSIQTGTSIAEAQVAATPPRASWRTKLKANNVAGVEKAGKKVPLKELQLKHFASIQPNMNSLSDKDLVDILKANDIKADKDRNIAIDQLIDIAVFGTPFPCVECPDGALVFCPSKQLYVCQGYRSEYTRCFNETKKPMRSDFVLPKSYHKEKYSWLRECRHPDLKERILSRAVAVHLESGGKDEVKPQIIKNNTVVEAGFELATDSHVVTTPEGDYYTAMLNQVDLSSRVNVYCKIQLLKHDIDNSHFVYTCTGTVGGSHETRDTNRYGSNFYGAQLRFQEIFKEKTGNLWDNRKYFNKRPGLFSLADVNLDYSEVKGARVIKPGSQTSLHPSVKDVILLISDKDAMKEVMTALKIDVEKMPLGKLSAKTISTAFKVLSDLEQLIKNENMDKLEFEDANNQFYTLIPHSFDKTHSLPKLNKIKQIKEKCRLLEVLRDLQVAIGVLSGGDFINGEAADPVDVHYLNLKCKLSYLDPAEPDYTMISKYLSTTHGGTHNFKLQIIDVLKVHRDTESSKFKACLGNRKLLWHGSGTANFTGILSQGLRIAPPEAPVSGYMFGKGIYFADMVSKSAQYCRTGGGGTCFLLLCDVALGLEQNEYQATNSRKKGRHSVKGLGLTQPDPKNVFRHEDGFSVPMGPAVQDRNTQYHLHYNEYIVYDVDQVMIRYLVKCHIK